MAMPSIQVRLMLRQEAVLDSHRPAVSAIRVGPSSTKCVTWLAAVQTIVQYYTAVALAVVHVEPLYCCIPEYLLVPCCSRSNE